MRVSVVLPASKQPVNRPSRLLAGGRAISYVVVPIAMLLLWQVCATVFAKSFGPFFPQPARVAAALVDWAFGTSGVTQIYSGQLIWAILDSARRIFLGYFFGSAIGIPLGVLVGWFLPVRRFIDPTLQVVRPIPVTAWVPISMLWFGIGDIAAVYLIVLAAFFPIYINTMQGVRYVDPVVVRAGRMLGAKGAKLLTFVVLPAALPSIFAGLRISLGFSWMAVVVSELVAVKNGLGYVMFEAYGFLRADIVIAAMIVIGTLGFWSDRVMVRVERYALRWAQPAG